MIANTIKKLPVTLLEIKSVAMNDDFITNIKQKITEKKKTKKYQKYFHYVEKKEIHRHVDDRPKKKKHINSTFKK